MHRTAHGLTSGFVVDAGQFEHDTTGLDVRNPPLRRTLTGTHPGLGRLLGQRAVRVDVDPPLPATLDVTGHRDTCGLDLPVGDVGRLEGLDAEVAERDLGSALGRTGPPRVVLLPVFDPAGHQHGAQASPLVVAVLDVVAVSDVVAVFGASDDAAATASTGAVAASAGASVPCDGREPRLGRSLRCGRSVRPRPGRPRPGAPARAAACASRSARVPATSPL